MRAQLQRVEIQLKHLTASCVHVPCDEIFKFCTFAWFVRGRGVATGLKDPSRVRACNEIINAMPSYERSSEYRSLTDAELELDRQSAIARAAKAPTKKKRKRDHALAQQQLTSAA